MTFAWPLALAALALLPLLVVLDVRARRRRSRYAVAFTNVDLLRRVAPRGSAWRHHLRLALLLAALAALIVGLARPQTAVSVTKRAGTIVLAMDTSGSMVADDVPPTRLAAATRAAQSFVDDLPSTFEVGVVPFSTTAEVAVAPTGDRQAVHDALGRLSAQGGTAIGEAIARSLTLLGTSPGANGQAASPAGGQRGGRAILLLSDGANTSGVDPLVAAQWAKQQGVPVYTIAFGTPDGTVQPGGIYSQPVPVPPDPDTLRAVAEATGGEFFAVADADALKRVYDHIGTRIGATRERRDVSYAFAAAGAALLVGAGVLSVLWRSPLP